MRFSIYNKGNINDLYDKIKTVCFMVNKKKLQIISRKNYLNSKKFNSEKVMNIIYNKIKNLKHF